MSDAGSERGSRRPFEQGDGKVRDFSNWERKGPLLPAASAAPSLREGGRQRSKDGPQFRKASPAWGEPRSQDGSRPPRREYQEKPVIERAPTAAEMDNQWRTKMKADVPAKSPTPSRDTSTPPSPAPAPLPATRPRLNLQKRTVSEAEPSLSNATPAADSKASPFGAARPVDTSAKEREIEEKRQLAIRQKREAEEKLKAAKAEEKRLAKEAEEQGVAGKDTEETESTDIKEVSADAPQPGRNFEILRRASENGNEIDGDENEEVDAEVGAPVDDKAVKPKEVVRDARPAKANGQWRGKGPKPKEAPAPAQAPDTAKTLEEDGWSTVSNTKQRNNRRGNQAARAIAS